MDDLPLATRGRMREQTAEALRLDRLLDSILAQRNRLILCITSSRRMRQW